MAGRTVTDVIRGVSDSPKNQPGKILPDSQSIYFNLQQGPEPQQRSKSPVITVKMWVVHKGAC